METFFITKNFDLISKIKNICKDLDCEVKISIATEADNRKDSFAVVTLKHEDLKICKFAQYLSERMILEVQQLNIQTKDIKLEPVILDLTGLNIVDCTAVSAIVKVA